VVLPFSFFPGFWYSGLVDLWIKLANYYFQEKLPLVVGLGFLLEALFLNLLGPSQLLGRFHLFPSKLKAGREGLWTLTYSILKASIPKKPGLPFYSGSKGPVIPKGRVLLRPYFPRIGNLPFPFCSISSLWFLALMYGFIPLPLLKNQNF